MKTKLLLTILVVLGLFISFYRLPDFYFLDFDQERDYQVLSELVSHGKLTLIGPRAVSSAGFYLGPWYYYFLLPFYLLSFGHPLYAAAVAGLVNFFAAIALFSLTKKHTNKFAAFGVSLIWLSVLHRTAWNVMFLPLIVLGVIHLLLQKKQTRTSLILLTFLTSLGVHFHFQIILFLPFILLYFLVQKPKFPKFNFRLGLSLFIAFVIPLLPLIVFDLRHDFINTRAIINFFLGKLGESVGTPYLTLLFFSFRNLVREVGLYTPWSLFWDYRLLPLIYAGLLAYFYKSKKTNYLLISLFPLVSLLVLSFYSPPTWPEYYHLSASLVFLLMIGIAFNDQRSAKILLLVALINAIIVINTLSAPTDPFAYTNKANAIKYILEQTKPRQPQIDSYFPYGEGLGFSPIRQYYSKGFSTEYDLDRRFPLAYPDNPIHNKENLRTFGAFGVSIIKDSKQEQTQ